MKILSTVGSYLKGRQPPLIRFIHITILSLVISQIIVSNFMGFTHAGAIRPDDVYGTWIHIITGLLLIPLMLLFVVIELRVHGFKHFFPYLFGEFEQLKADFAQLRTKQLPEAEPYGIAAVIQGLGLGAMILVLASGAIWFSAWNLGYDWAHEVRDIHKALTGLVEAYIVGHGGMGVLHIIMVSRRT